MKLLSVIVAHDRLEYTRRTVASYLDTVSVPHLLYVIDNGSTDGTAEYLADVSHRERYVVVWTMPNVYPGAACNFAWDRGAAGVHIIPNHLDLGAAEMIYGSEFSHLHRSDNDVEYQPGWCDEVEACFDAFPELGQLGILDMHDEGLAPVTKSCDGVTVNVAWPNIGGNCVIRRELWDAGLRWSEKPWGEEPWEDARFSADMVAAGWKHAHVTERIAVHIGHDWAAYPDYYAESARARGMEPEKLRAHFDACERRRRKALA